MPNQSRTRRSASSMLGVRTFLTWPRVLVIHSAQELVMHASKPYTRPKAFIAHHARRSGMDFLRSKTQGLTYTLFQWEGALDVPQLTSASGQKHRRAGL
ncbi:hypothetical protein K523DRAFT_72519 [Schizophyllum commune Tattone D]|nr:hypothetical protein K523DRAFT_72519 [Schizophyllum commune Tattone D]